MQKQGYYTTAASRTQRGIEGVPFQDNGFMEKTIYPDDHALDVMVRTESGTISIEIRDDEGETIFNESNIITDTFQVDTTSSRVVVTIRTEKHKGGFEISS